MLDKQNSFNHFLGVSLNVFFDIIGDETSYPPIIREKESKWIQLRSYLSLQPC